MKKRNIYTIVFIVSILGLAIVQYQYLRIGINLAKVQFSSKIGLASEDIRNTLETKNKLTFLLANAIEEDSLYFNISVDSLRDASSHFLNDFITEKLVEKGIDADFTYRLVTRDSTHYIKSPVVYERTAELVTYPIEIKGYLPTLLGTDVILELKFRNLDSYYLSKLNGLTVPSLLFILGIIVAILWILRTYYWQRNVITTTNEFINNLTHELKTPVFSIGLASKMLEGEISEEKAPVLDIIRQQVERLKNHIDKVLELASFEERQSIFNFEVVDFKPILEDLCKDFKTLTSFEEVHFEYRLAAGPYRIKAEVAHLENAINNLLENAKKYSEEPKIEMESLVQKGKLVIRISDNGKGIGKRDQKLVFQKYYRVSDGNKYGVKGYGLGLSYVKRVIEKHNGKIDLNSEINKGTTIILKIPLYKHGKKI
ncbi:sensor histidine kinase [Maribacter polysiphoniae]|uniref:histidine kinase n=1 Tax=Maribacter polysiphoniae TaxID=429344 RepID=A0A316DMG0_9FLAO|nr:HAMP domain-containing sensor histidine kinase [Maribacter polysiphoniae]PWK19367.1 two-component system phosphate regulon sensor histidine kinase PhoR [Maribacter polysiphoniae]